MLCTRLKVGASAAIGDRDVARGLLELGRSRWPPGGTHPVSVRLCWSFGPESRRTFREQGSVEGSISSISTLDPSSPFLWPPVMMASEPTASGASAAAMASVKTG